MTRLEGAIFAVRQAISAAATIPLDSIGEDEDICDDLNLDELELESLGLIIDEVFAITVPSELWDSALYRTSATLAEWCIARSTEAAWAASRHAQQLRQRRYG